MTDLYHVTVWQSVEDIFADGLKQNAAIRARQAADATGEDALDPMAPTPKEEIADRKAEELISAARQRADIPPEWPRHADGVFFWPTKAQAIKAANSITNLPNPRSDPIVAVNREDIPGDSLCLIGDAIELDPIFQTYWNQASSGRLTPLEDEDEMFERVVEWWRGVEVYTGQAYHDHEVWCDSDVPPEAIEWIHDPENDRRLYEPPDDPEQQRLIDL